MIRILNRRTLKEIPPGAYIVHRPTPLGNPYEIGPDGSRDEVCEKYEYEFLWKIEHDVKFRNEVLSLKGATALVCFCAPLRCHAETIARYLERMEV